MADPRVLFFGMDGPFSSPPLAALLAACTVCGVVVPRPPGREIADEPVRRLLPPTLPPYHIPLLTTPSPANAISLAWAAGVPVLEVAAFRDARTLGALEDLRPDLICVACFPRLLPGALLRLARHGAINLHPSLLPDYRGPAPLFWVFHDGLEHAGVTIHALDEGADTGEILAQRPLVLPDGIGYDQAERQCAEAAAQLLLDTLPALVSGSEVRRPQPPGAAPAAPMPTGDDFVLTPAWSARRAFNFVRGIAAWGRPIRFESDGERIAIASAVAYDLATTPAIPVQRRGRDVQLRCSPGVLTVTI